MGRARTFALAAVAALTMAPAPNVPLRGPDPAFERPLANTDLSVMTYNIKGLPWPIGHDRISALLEIGDRLRAMRVAGMQPQVVLLQEAFTDQAKGIARSAGYRYAAFGPQQAANSPTRPLGVSFAKRARWDRGESSGALLDSGLAILSDYPIVRTRRIAFPQGACAGFDCLASKGVLIAWIAVPGTTAPLALIDTHLNSRHATHVALDRADRANAWQLGALRRAIGSSLDPSEAAILGGDTNVGRVATRIAALATNPPLGPGQRDDVSDVRRDGTVATRSRAEIAAVVARNKDMLLSRAGLNTMPVARRAWVPFGLLQSGALSDHAGYVIDYRLARSGG